MENIRLRTGTKVPVLGLGCFKSEAETGERSVREAIEAGYRHIDTANFYENEKYVGEGIRKSGIQREELFVVSKIWPTSYDNPRLAIEYSLESLDIDYIDMYLLHWPGLDEYKRYQAFEECMRFKEKGYLKEVGVSNFKRHHLEEFKAHMGFYPAMNQIEISPWLPKKEDLSFCLENDIVVTACVPFAKGEILNDPILKKMAEKYNKTVGQVILRWNVQRGNCVIPKSSKPERIRENMDIFDFEIEPGDMKIIGEMETGQSYCSDADYFTGDFWTLEKNLLKDEREEKL